MNVSNIDKFAPHNVRRVVIIYLCVRPIETTVFSDAQFHQMPIWQNIFSKVKKVRVFD